MLIIECPVSGKTNALLNLIKKQHDSDCNIIDKNVLYAKGSNETKYSYFNKKHGKIGLKHLRDPKTLTEYLKYMEDVYKRIEECSTDSKCKVLIVFDDIIADLISNKKHSLIVTELFISRRKLNFLRG